MIHVATFSIKKLLACVTLPANIFDHLGASEKFPPPTNGFSENFRYTNQRTFLAYRNMDVLIKCTISINNINITQTGRNK